MTVPYTCISLLSSYTEQKTVSRALIHENLQLTEFPASKHEN